MYNVITCVDKNNQLKKIGPPERAKEQGEAYYYQGGTVIISRLPELPVLLRGLHPGLVPNMVLGHARSLDVGFLHALELASFRHHNLPFFRLYLASDCFVTRFIQRPVFLAALRPDFRTLRLAAETARTVLNTRRRVVAFIPSSVDCSPDLGTIAPLLSPCVVVHSSLLLDTTVPAKKKGLVKGP